MPTTIVVMVVVVILTQVFDIVPITYAIGALAVMFTLKKIFSTLKYNHAVLPRPHPLHLQRKN